MGKKKVVLDTNVFISALGWKGNPNKIFQKVISGGLELFISYDQLAELRHTLDYPKFHFTNEQKERLFMLILEVANIVESTEKLDIIKGDPDDNIILECAFSGEVDYIISGDGDLLRLGKFRGIKIVTPGKFVELIG